MYYVFITDLMHTDMYNHIAITRSNAGCSLVVNIILKKTFTPCGNTVPPRTITYIPHHKHWCFSTWQQKEACTGHQVIRNAIPINGEDHLIHTAFNFVLGLQVSHALSRLSIYGQNHVSNTEVGLSCFAPKGNLVKVVNHHYYHHHNQSSRILFPKFFDHALVRLFHSLPNSYISCGGCHHISPSFKTTNNLRLLFFF